MTTHLSAFPSRQVAPLTCEVVDTAWLPSKEQAVGRVAPNILVRWAFVLSVFAIPFSSLYVPGTGDKVGVLRLIQLALAGAVLSQPRVCLRWVPAALFWFIGYIVLRIVWGFWLTPEMADYWWPSSREFISILPWVWVSFNVLQFPEMHRRGLWALGFGCLFCALCHIVGIGEMQVSGDLENRSSVFGMQANELGATYATAMIALLGLWMSRTRTWTERILPLPMFVIIGVAMAKTGSRTAIILLAVGMVVLFFFCDSTSSKIKRSLGLLTLVAVLIAILWQIPTVVARFQEINPQNIGENNPRARMAPVLWEMFLRNPVCGLGPEGYQWELTRRAMPYLVNQGKTITAHNQILMLLVETGMVGLLVFSAGIAMALAAAWRARSKSCGPLPLALIFPQVVVAATVTHPWQSLVLWFAVACSLAGGVRETFFSETAKSKSKPPQS